MKQRGAPIRYWTPVARARHARGLTTSQLADLMDVTWRMVQHWSSGTRPVPEYRRDKLAEVLGYPRSYLFPDEEQQA